MTAWSNVVLELLARRKPSSLVGSRHAESEEEAAPLPSFREAMQNWRDALQHGDHADMVEAGAKLREENDRHYRMAGVPPLAHDLVPSQAIEDFFARNERPPTREDVHHLGAIFEPTARPLIAQQAMQLVEGRRTQPPQALAEEGCKSCAGQTLRRIGSDAHNPFERREAHGDDRFNDETDRDSANGTTVELSMPRGSFPEGREPKDVNCEHPRYPWHPRWEEYALHRDPDGSEWGEWRTKDNDYEVSNDGGKTWHRAEKSGPNGSWSGGPPNKCDNPRGRVYRKTKTDLIS